ncbi:MAG: helix-turn-helix domain-containing protein [Pseudomonas sp.]
MEGQAAGQERLAYTLEEVQQLISASKGHLRNLINGGDLPARKSRRKTLILRSDLEAYLKGLPTA